MMEGARLAVRLQGLAGFPLQWRCLALPQQFLLVLLLFEDRHFDRDLLLLLTTLWSVDRWCCVDDYSPQLQKLFILYFPLPCSTGMYLGIVFARYQTTGVKCLHSTPCSALDWTYPNTCYQAGPSQFFPPSEEEGKHSWSILSHFG